MADATDFYGLDSSNFGPAIDLAAIEGIRRRQADAQAAKIARSNEREMRRLPPDVLDDIEEPSQGMPYNILDTIGTPGQWVQGGIAKIAGSPGYEDLSFLEAAAKGAKDDRYTGDLLKDLGWLQGEDIGSKGLRFLVSFAGDVATDPLTYITTLPKVAIAGLGVVDDAFKLTDDAARALGKKTGTLAELTEALRLKKIAEATTAISEKVPDLTKLPDDVLQGIEAAAGAEATNWARVLRRIQDTEKKASVTGDHALLLEKGIADPDGLKALFQSKVLEPLGIDPEAVLSPSQLVQKRGIRLGGIVPSGGGGFLKDIPLVTKGSEELFDLLGTGMYNATHKLGVAADKLIDWGYAGEGVRKKVGQSAKVIKSITTGGRKLLSRKAEAGGDLALENITQAQAARYVARVNRTAQVASLKDGLDDIASTKIGQVLEAQPEIFEDKLRALVKSEEARIPGAGEKIDRIVRRTRAELDASWAEAHKAGVLDTWTDSYMVHAYEPNDAFAGFKAEELIDNFKRKQGSSLDPTKHRKYQTLNDALAAGLRPKFDALEMFGERMYWHDVAMASAKMRDRIYFELATPKSTANALRQILVEGTEQEAKIALQGLKKRGLEINPSALVDKDGIADAVAKSGLNVFRTPEGDILDPHAYLQMQDAAADLGRYRDRMTPDRIAAAELLKKRAANMGLNLTDPAEFARVSEGFAKARSIVEARGGRAGELLTDRAGLTPLSDKFKPTLKQLAKLSPEDADFYKGELPLPFVNALEDALDTRSSIDKYIASRPKNDPFAQSLGFLRDAYIGWLRVMKEATTHFYPAYFARNAAGAPFQAMAAMQNIGEAVNPLWAIEVNKLAKGIGGFRARGSGRYYTAKELKFLEQYHNVRTPVGAEVDLIRTQAEGLWTKMDKPLPKGWYEKTMSPLRSFGQAIETYGRRSLFYKLLKDGMDPESAAQMTRKYMVDYQWGKTRFEKDFVNNTLFFYSFPKATMANALSAFTNNPGSITTQLHAHAAAAELLRDPNAMPLPEGMEDKLATLRSNEIGMRRHLGYDAHGNPEFLNQAGLPVESLASFVSLKTPKTLKFGDLVHAGTDSLGRSIQLTLAQTNPLISKTLEMISGKSLYFDRPITDRSLRKLANLKNETAMLAEYPYTAIPRGVMELMDAATMAAFDAKDNGDGSFTIDPYRLAILSAIVPGASRMVNTYSQIAKDDEADSKIARLLTGLHPVAVDPEKSAAYDTRARIQEAKAKSGYPTNKFDQNLYGRLNPKGGGIDEVMFDLFGEDEE